MGALMRAHDWTSGSMGSPLSWPQALKTSLRLLLSTQHPMFIWWGPDLIQFYNDAYRRSIGPERHPSALGQPGRECWAEIWDIIGPQIELVLSGSGSTWNENSLVPITRSGRREEVYWTYSYSPIDHPESPHGVGGVLVICLETTLAVLAEKRRLAESKRQRRLFERAPGFIAILHGPDHVFEFVNDSYVRLVGNRDLIGRKVLDAFPEVREQGFLELLDTVFRTGQPFTATRTPIRLQRTPDGAPDERFLDFIYQPVTDEDGAVTGVFVEGFDVTESHSAQLALQQSEAQLRRLNADLERQVVERSGERGLAWKINPDLLGVLNADGYFETSNPAWLTILGWSPEEVARQSIFELLHPDDLQRTRTGFKLALRGEPSIRFPNRYRCKDGSYRWISWVGIPEDGKVYCIGRDITAERRQAEELAARTAERNRLWTNSQDILVVIDTAGVFHAVNPALTRILGWEAHELVGHDAFQFIHSDDQARTRNALVRAGGSALSNFENRYRHKDGGYRWLSWVTAPEGDLIYATARHITAQKEAEAELAAAQDALRQSQKLEAMGQLTGGVAHDFNNLLAPIVATLDMLLRRGIGSDRERRLIEGALQSAERAKVLVQRLLAFSRRQPLQPTAIDLATLIKGMADLISSTTGPQIKVIVDIESNLPAAMADPNQLEMAILNLSVNARDAIEQSGVLRISAHAERIRRGHRSKLRPGDYVRLSVEDTGKGMDEETLARAVEPFFSTKGIGKGTGLGLSMVHGLASQLGGSLVVSSKPGLGANVELWLPASEAPAVTAGALAIAAAHPKVVGAALVVDDEELVRASTADMLAEIGYEVIEAGSAEEATRLIDQGLCPDVVITDHAMPGRSGVDLAREVQARHPATRIIIVSGYAEAEGVDADLARLTKPFRQSELIEILGGNHRDE